MNYNIKNINRSVSGDTAVYGVIGSPIEHTMSPFIHNTIKDATEDNIIYVPFHVEKDNLEQAIKGAFGLNIKGLNVTVPHKKDVIPFLVDVDKSAQTVGAVNTLKMTDKEGYIGYNTDVYGIMNVFKFNNIDVKNKNVIIIGAGGAAYAAASALCSMEANKIIIGNRTVENGKKLATHMTKHYNTDIDAISLTELNERKFTDISTIVQASSVGLSHTQSPISNTNIFKNTEFAFDLIYSPAETTFLKQALSMGIKGENGFGMLVSQAVAAYEIWTGRTFSKKFILSLKDKLLK